MKLNNNTKIIMKICHVQYFFAKFAFNNEIEANIAKNNEEIIMQITENFIFGY